MECPATRQSADVGPGGGPSMERARDPVEEVGLTTRPASTLTRPSPRRPRFTWPVDAGLSRVPSNDELRAS